MDVLAARLLTWWGSARPQAAAPAATEGASGSPVAGLRDRLVLLYMGLAALALLPGLAHRLDLPLDGLAGGPALAAVLRANLTGITFGSGLRFWLGVTGALMMALLVLYPLRKAFFKARVPGSVAGWFHLHIVLGFVGPVLIAYHAGFSHGGFNANVALWTMVVITLSGIVGFFVYARVSRDFYVTNERARQHRKALISALPDDANARHWKSELTAVLEAFEAEILKPRQGVIPSLRARLRVERRRRPIVQMISVYVDEYARVHGLNVNEYRAMRAAVGGHLRAYFALARASMSQSIGEQLWARWRLFHMPLFVIMVAAAILHVIAVWGMDATDAGPAAAAVDGEPPVQGAQVAANGAGPRSMGELIARLPETQPVGAPADPKQAAASAPGAGPPQQATPPKAKATAAAVAAPVLVAEPRPVTRRSKAAPEQTPIATAPAAGSVNRSRPPVSASAFDPPAQSVARAGSSSSQPTEATPAQVFAKFEKPPGTQPMGLGLGGAGPMPATLEEQLIHFKALKTSGQFSHSEAETGFELTGKHLKAECTACHKQPLREVAQRTAPRQCITCHKSDDIHKGRRPDCQNCHTTNRWTQILRRK